jgi:hypothetical protein
VSAAMLSCSGWQVEQQYTCRQESVGCWQHCCLIAQQPQLAGEAQQHMQ